MLHTLIRKCLYTKTTRLLSYTGGLLTKKYETFFTCLASDPRGRFTELLQTCLLNKAENPKIWNTDYSKHKKCIVIVMSLTSVNFKRIPPLPLWSPVLVQLLLLLLWWTPHPPLQLEPADTTYCRHYYEFNSAFSVNMLRMRTHRREWWDQPLDTLSRPTGRDVPGPKSKWTAFWECRSPRPPGASLPLIIHTDENMIHMVPCILYQEC